MNPLANRDAAPDTGAENDTEHRLEPLPGPVQRLREREAIRVIGHAYGLAESSLEVGEEWATIEPGGVGVLDQSCGSADGPGNADSYASQWSPHRPRSRGRAARSRPGFLHSRRPLRYASWGRRSGHRPDRSPRSSCPRDRYRSACFSQSSSRRTSRLSIHSEHRRDYDRHRHEPEPQPTAASRKTRFSASAIHVRRGTPVE